VKKRISLIGLLILILGLAACGSVTENAGSDGESNTSSASSDSVSETAEKVRLSDEYTDALPVQTQLAVGTLQLLRKRNGLLMRHWRPNSCLYGERYRA
jgi:ABC-type glycerol-3-phosphate transport system substrate-binding protein